jgi:3-(3-hydroxy-phenyl)propionate hydroxylase
VQDADNLAWKLALVLDGRAPERLLDSYASERELAADENILNSTRSTDFITPKSTVSRTFRDAALTLARDCAFARGLVNSGRLSVPTVLTTSPLNTLDQDRFEAGLAPGSPSTDAPVRIDSRDDWLLRQVGGGFAGVYFSDGNTLSPARLAALAGLHRGTLPVEVLLVEPRGVRPGTSDGVRVVEDCEGLLARRLDAEPGTFYLLRPDQHVAARWKHFEPEQVKAAVARATCNA